MRYHKVDMNYVDEKYKHYLALGYEEIYMDTAREIPWENIEELKPGGTFRHGMCITLRASMTHHSGLKLTWLVDLEHDDANGKPLNLNNSLIRDIVTRSDPKIVKPMKDWFEDAIKICEREEQIYQNVLESYQQSKQMLKNCVEQMENMY